jgi:hypothetical protein
MDHGVAGQVFHPGMDPVKSSTLNPSPSRPRSSSRLP